MKHIIRISSFIALLACFALLSGCASGPKFSRPSQIPKDKALVYIYKQGGFRPGGARRYRVYINNAHIFTLGSGLYYLYSASPGPVALQVKLRGGYGTLLEAAMQKNDTLTLNAAAGNVYYFALSESGFLVSDIKLVPVPPETAEKEIQDCKLAPPESH